MISTRMTGRQRIFDEPASSQADRAYGALLEDIVTLRLQPGELLADEELRGRLALGRGPIREALQRLASERLVVVLPRRGTLVSEIVITDIGEIYEVRCTLEGLAARLAAERFGDGTMPPEIAEDLAAMHSTSDLISLLAIDYRLHRVVYRLARNSYLLESLNWYLTLSFRLVLAATQRLRTAPVEELIDAMDEFNALFEAIRTGDAARAEEIARRHSGFTEMMLRRTM